jgi:murein L,D-transpeptidase YafK
MQGYFCRFPNVAKPVLLLALPMCLCASGCDGNKGPSPTTLADGIVIVKSQRTMTLMGQGQVLRSYTVALGREPLGPKERAGDHKTPEGQYVVDAKNAKSRFHLALHISYPNATDRERARKLGVDPGGDVEIHGVGRAFFWVGSLHRWIDWTDGCVAVTNSEIEEIWPLVPVGTRVEIRP